DRFVALCAELDVKFEIEEAQDPKKLSAFLKKIANHPQKQILHMLLLRAMKQPVYAVDNIGHFGLASPAYLHFTSPIRRYPDLRVHRQIKHILRGGKTERSDTALEDLQAAAQDSSKKERAAMEVERQVLDLYRAVYMQRH